MSDELIFASEKEAIQHLADITGDQIIIASRFAHSYETSIELEDEEPDVIVEFDYSPAEEETYSSESMEITSVVRKDNKKEIIGDLNKEQIESLEEGALGSLEDEADADLARAEDHFDSLREEN